MQFNNEINSAKIFKNSLNKQRLQISFLHIQHQKVSLQVDPKYIFIF